MTQTGRETVSIMVIVVQLMVFSILGRATTSVWTLPFVARLQVLGELDLIDKISSQLIGVAAGGFSLQALLNLLTIYLTSIVGVITHELLIVLYGMAFKKRGTAAIIVYVFTACVLW
jgi:hypothetical protein